MRKWRRWRWGWYVSNFIVGGGYVLLFNTVFPPPWDSHTWILFFGGVICESVVMAVIMISVLMWRLR